MEGQQTVTLRHLGAVLNLTPSAGAAAFSLALAPGDYAVYAENSVGEVGASQTFQVPESGTTITLPAELASPSCPAQVTVKVVEANGAADAGTPLAARVEAYEAPDPKGHTPLSTVSTDATSGSATLRVPVGSLGDGAEKSVWLFTSRGLSSNGLTTGALLKAGTDNAAITIRLAPPLDQSLTRDPGTPRAIDAVLYSVALGGVSALGPGGFVRPEERVANAQAEGLDLFLGGDEQVALDYTPFLHQAAYAMRALSLANGLKISGNQGTLRAYGVTLPADRPAYYGLPVVSYLEGGSYSGKRPPSLWVKDLKDAYQATLVELAVPRLGGEKGAFLDSAKFNPHQAFTLNGKEARDTLTAIDLFEVYEGSENFAFTYAALQDWYALIAQNLFKPAVAHDDLATRLGPNSQRIGAPRTYVYLNRSETPSAASLLAALRAGRAIISGGPIVQIDLGGVLPGGTYDAAKDTTAALPDIAFNLKVSAAAQVSATRAFICVNGTDLSAVALGGADQALRLDARQHITLPRKDPNNAASPFQDSWFVVMVLADKQADSAPIYAKRPPFAITNPIFIEADGSAGLSFPALPSDGRPLCVNEAICDSFADYDIAKKLVAIPKECCGLFPPKITASPRKVRHDRLPFCPASPCAGRGSARRGDPAPLESPEPPQLRGQHLRFSPEFALPLLHGSQDAGAALLLSPDGRETLYATAPQPMKPFGTGRAPAGTNRPRRRACRPSLRLASCRKPWPVWRAPFTPRPIAARSVFGWPSFLARPPARCKSAPPCRWRRRSSPCAPSKTKRKSPKSRRRWP